MRAETEQRAERAYLIRKKTGCSWAFLGGKFGCSDTAIWQVCRRWARKNRKVWPPSELLSFGRICYELAALEGMNWDEVAAELSRSRHEVMKSARGYCKTKGIDWPYWGRFNQNG